MAGEDRTASHALKNPDVSSGLELFQQLEQTPYKFDFFHALRLIECLHPDKPRIGTSPRPLHDPIRLAQRPEMYFSPSTLASCQSDPRTPPRLSVYFFGLLGPNGPMPLHLTEYAKERLVHHHDRTFARFLDLFHHRFLSIFYRAWAAAQPTVSFDRPEQDRFGVFVGSLFGIGMESMRGRDRVWDIAKLHYAGRLSCQTKHAEGLQYLLEDFFKVPVDLEQFVGEWMRLPKDCQCRLGESPATGLMGSTVIVGERIWECQRKFRLYMGPMDFKSYQRLLPTGDSLGRLVDWVKNYIGEELAWDVNLILKKDEVPMCQLGQQGQLGWTTWLKTKEFEDNADDLLLRPYAA